MLKAIIVFCISLIITLIVNIPANWLYSQLKTQPAPIILSNVEGTIWSGSSSVFAPMLSPQYSADNWQWGFNASALLKAQLSWDLFHEKQNLSATIAIDLLSLGSSYDIVLHNNVNSLSSINPIFNLVSAEFSAQLSNFQSQQCIDNAGTINLKNITFSGLNLAQLKADISCTNTGAFKLDYASLDNSTNIKGSITIDSRGYYQSSMTASSTNKVISQQLESIASKTLSKDKYLIQGNGYL